MQVTPWLVLDVYIYISHILQYIYFSDASQILLGPFWTLYIDIVITKLGILEKSQL